jgi:DNA adenine methylase
MQASAGASMWSGWGPLLEEIHERLSGIVIECLRLDAFIARYDDPATLFYLDPPYWNSEDDYGHGTFAKADFAGLGTVLSKIRGRFILSVNDFPETREFFARFRLEPVSTRYTIAGG